MRVRVAVVVGLVIASVLAVGAPAGAAPAWSVVPPAPGALYGHLSGVSCPTPTTCFAVGIQDSGATRTRMIQRWNGKKWTAVPSPNPTGAASSQLAAVHCLSIASCFAVGQYTTPGFKTRTLIQRWNGKVWSIVPSPNPVATPVSGLASVHCTSSTSCFAVGGYFESTPDSSAQLPLILRWNGTAWSIVPSPTPDIALDSELEGVTCNSPTLCFAVGNYRTEVVTNTLILQWNGTTWAIVPSPNPGSSTLNELSSVACPLATSCVAVGSGHGTLVEVWNGTTWSIVSSPNPAGSNGASLTSVSCPIAARCFAVGDSFQAAKVSRLAMLITPTSRRILNLPVPANTKLSHLNGVSCASIASCFAVGDYRTGPSRRPLLIRYA